MPIKYYNQPPYYDDFDKTKNYLRVLFQPGRAVQARELTQLQTAIQAQIERFGNYVFKEGTRVTGAESVLDKKYAFVKLEETFQYPASSGGTHYYPEGTSGSDAYYQTAVDQSIEGLTSGVTALVLEAVHSTEDDYLTIYVNYTAAGTDNVSHFFSAGEILQFVDADNVTRYFKVVDAPGVESVGYGTRFSITEGSFFTKGNFVYTPAASIIVSKYTTNPSARIVYAITESVIGASTDATLADNSLGTPNSSAPGADRYQINLNLTTQPYSDSDRTEENIIQLMAVRGGLITGNIGNELNELNKVLAQRTFEESGNYTVKPFALNVREYLNDGTNTGVYTVAQIISDEGFTGGTATADATAFGKARLAVGLERGIAYVNGFRVQTLDTTYIPVLKARDEAFTNSATMVCPLGGYLVIDTLVGLPNITSYSTITLKNVSNASIGTARARGIEKFGSNYKLYLFDVAITSPNAFSDVTSVQDTTVDGYDFSANVVIDPIVGYAQIQDTTHSSLVYKLPADAISTLLTNATSDVNYYVRRTLTDSTGGGTSITFNAVTHETFYSTTASDYICTKASDGSIAASPTITLGSGTVTIGNLATGATYYVSAPVYRTGDTFRKSKTLVSSATKSISSPNTTIGGSDNLGKCDILKIRNVWMSPDFNTAATTSHIDISDRYELDNGQRENLYDLGKIILKTGQSKPTGQLLVVFDYFTHGVGDYFTVDSYSDIAYEDIPSFNSIKGNIELRDAIDFRPRKNDAGTGFTSTGASTTNAVVPGSLLVTDIYNYLARADKIYVNKNGEFNVAYGASAVKPLLPPTPADSMLLYTLKLNPYTFGAKDLSSSFVENRRYTMRDIGRLEKRIRNIEYYTSLSQLEKETAGKQIWDNGSQRYKNGFVADAFINHSIGAVDHPDYACAIDPATNTCRPRLYVDNAALVFNAVSSDSNVKKTGDLVTLNFSEVPMIQQKYASDAEYVNPHAVYGWNGKVTLSPSSDDWVETEYLSNDTQTSYTTNTSGTTVDNGYFNSWTLIYGRWSTWYWNSYTNQIVYTKPEGGTVTQIIGTPHEIETFVEPNYGLDEDTQTA